MDTVGAFPPATNLKQIGLAFHNYLSANDQFPAMATYGPDGLPTLRMV
jgi:hypothetical protein